VSLKAGWPNTVNWVWHKQSAVEPLVPLPLLELLQAAQNSSELPAVLQSWNWLLSAKATIQKLTMSNVSVNAVNASFFMIS